MLAGFKLRKIYQVGFCVGRGILADRTLSWKKVRFYARSFLIEHPQKGLILIDTGYGQNLIEATQKGIYSLYRSLLPVTFKKEDSVVFQLEQDGIFLKDLSYLLITHFHPDHIGALFEFRRVPWIFRSDALERLMSFSRLRGLKHGFIRSLVPSIPEESIAVKDDFFTQVSGKFRGVDLFGDGSLLLIDLPGHALGQMGVLIENTFFVADAKWTDHGFPHSLGFFLQQDRTAYRRTFEDLKTFPDSIQIIATHTVEAH